MNNEQDIRLAYLFHCLCMKITFTMLLDGGGKGCGNTIRFSLFLLLFFFVLFCCY